MKYKIKNYYKKASLPTMVVMLFCFLFTSCNKDTDNFSAVTPTTSSSAKSLYFYGSGAEFMKFKGVDIKQITTKQQLKQVTSAANDSYALFVGKDIDVRAGLIDNLRNSGTLVTQLKGKSNEKKALPAQAALIKNVKSGTESASGKEENLEDQLSFVTYLSVNGEHKILQSIFESTGKAVPRILEWREKKIKENEKASMSKSSSDVTAIPGLSFDYMINQHAEIGLNTKLFKGAIDGYSLQTNNGLIEYSDTFIYNHSIQTDPLGGATVGNVQIIQEPTNLFISSLDYRLEEYSPANTSNGTLDGSSGSESIGFSIGSGLSLSGPDVNNSADWSQSTDWSRPACRVYTDHSAGASERYQVMYDIDTNSGASWYQRSVDVKGTSAYMNNLRVEGYIPRHTQVPVTYFVHLVTDYNVSKDLLIYMNDRGQVQAWIYHNGYFNDPGNNTPQNTYSW